MRPAEYLKMKYSAPPECCKCGDCQLVPPGDLRAWDDEIQALKMQLNEALRAQREYDPAIAPCDDAEFGMKP
jgi:hypothetical protein